MSDDIEKISDIWYDISVILESMYYEWTGYFFNNFEDYFDEVPESLIDFEKSVYEMVDKYNQFAKLVDDKLEGR